MQCFHLRAKEVKEQHYECQHHGGLHAYKQFAQPVHGVYIAIANGGRCDDAEVDIVEICFGLAAQQVQPRIDHRETEHDFQVVEEQHQYIPAIRSRLHKHIGYKYERCYIKNGLGQQVYRYHHRDLIMIQAA